MRIWKPRQPRRLSTFGGRRNDCALDSRHPPRQAPPRPVTRYCTAAVSQNAGEARPSLKPGPRRTNPDSLHYTCRRSEAGISATQRFTPCQVSPELARERACSARVAEENATLKTELVNIRAELLALRSEIRKTDKTLKEADAQSPPLVKRKREERSAPGTSPDPSHQQAIVTPAGSPSSGLCYRPRCNGYGNQDYPSTAGYYTEQAIQQSIQQHLPAMQQDIATQQQNVADYIQERFARLEERLFALEAKHLRRLGKATTAEPTELHMHQGLLFPNSRLTLARALQVADLPNLIKPATEGTTIKQVTRLGKSRCVKLVFQGDCIPAYVKVGHFRHAVRPFVPKPLQRHKCLKIGHCQLSRCTRRLLEDLPSPKRGTEGSEADGKRPLVTQRRISKSATTQTISSA
ncbi:hypothetical protein HPB48_002988 [Haemaphysalis longicornis]|uniref:Uncharacterized protein n=1 Tax=Haemaphysalis longicornis TaxID=44386 RepID=A0A9J6F748_HAELO|nr:hypothetical protein HPB48_002988 [Haemaphysalis longicornis]